MRKFLFALLALPLLATACGGDDEPDPAKPQPSTAVITLSVSDIAVPAEGGTYEFTLSSTSDWSISSDQAWCKVSHRGGLKDTPTTITATVDQNKDFDPREANITVRSGNQDKKIAVNQDAPASIEVDALNLTTGAAASTLTIKIKANGSWTATAADSWVKITPATGVAGEHNLSAEVSANDSGADRETKVTIACGSMTKEVALRQLSDAIETPAGYNLVWHDEFDSGDRLGRDWTHEVKNSGWVNNELQNYVNGEVGGKRVTEIENGILKINCFKLNNKVYSGRVYAKVGTGWLYGYFEARIKLPSGKGTWPAFWMMPVNNDWGSNPWPKCGEIDIMEEVGYNPNRTSSSIHCEAFNHTIGTQKTHEQYTANAEGDFHTYAVEWTPEYLKFFVDGKEHMTFANDGKGHSHWPFHYAFYPILNLAWGGDWGGAKGVDESVLPVTMEVDYVRVFQKP